ncbi:MAG: hypothetical protein IKJ05_02100 [Oscillospiraceae bacterium]|nr:hypothetical protein [Oscillospiraceae bacterium]
MSNIKLKETPQKLKLSNRFYVIRNGMKATYIKNKEEAENLTEDNQHNSEEYANDMLDDMVSDTSNTAQELVKYKFKQSVQKKRAVNAQQNKSMRTNTAVSVENNAQFRHINTTQNRAKQRVVKNSIRARVSGVTTFKEKIVEFIKGGSVVVLNTAKIAIANAKILTATFLAMGGVAILFTIIICIIGLVMGSSFGIFMATEDTGTGYTLNSVIRKINEEYYTEIEKIKSEVPHDDLEMSNITPNWKDILAVYAVKVTTAENGAEVVTVDEQKAELIRNIFWNMTELNYETETYEDTDIIGTTDEQGNTIEQEVTITKTRLVIDTKNKTAVEAAVEYEFDENQNIQLQELMDDNNSGLWTVVNNEYKF